MTDTNEQLQMLLELLLATRPDEIDCEAFLEHVSGVFDALDEGAEPPPELAVVRQHLSVCPECREEYEALVRALES